ncbi:pheromone precursor 1 [Fusarium sporotrichioides]|uniref:Pheromone 1 n=1 Tax=Fusarium sporotrichioides TaxID=5514 RepID=A0A395SMY3_FUSSP|nr:pheromone precursor 1 [Fusarium sporotrichioides]
MKYSILTLAAVASTAFATAIPEPQPDPVAEAEPWCTWKGQPCWKAKMAKREAQPEPEAIAIPDPDPVAEPMPWCTWKGQPCWKEKMAKREAQPEPEAIPVPQPDPVAEAEPWCTWKGQPCWKEKMAKREAKPEPWCWWKGQPCWKTKRNAAPEPMPEPANEPRWCWWKGQPCWKSKSKRDASPEPWCWWKGQPCWKAKRDASEALTVALHATRGVETRSVAETEHLPRDAAHHAKRSIVELANVIALSARGSPEEYFKNLYLEEFFPEIPHNATAKRDVKTLQEDKRWCWWKGQPCWKAKRAAEAVLHAVDGADGAGAPGGPEEHFDTSNFNPQNFEAKRDLMAIKAAARSVVESLEG